MADFDEQEMTSEQLLQQVQQLQFANQQLHQANQQTQQQNPLWDKIIKIFKISSSLLKPPRKLHPGISWISPNLRNTMVIRLSSKPSRSSLFSSLRETKTPTLTPNPRSCTPAAYFRVQPNNGWKPSSIRTLPTSRNTTPSTCSWGCHAILPRVRFTRVTRYT